MPHPRLLEVTARIAGRSAASRRAYLDKINRMRDAGPSRPTVSCGNLAHAVAACPDDEKKKLTEGAVANIAIVSAYNDMLSAHQPYHAMLDHVKGAVVDAGGVAQMAGGVPAMCDGVTQGQPGMELSLFSRDVIAMATAVALSHNVFDGGLLFGVCDKIVPGLFIGALSFGHLPFVFVPAGPMPTGISNSEKQRVRQDFAAGRVGRKELLESESRAYHSPGTCTFYGTANSNQMMLEMMGLQMPGGSFVNPGDGLRPPLNVAAAEAVVALSAKQGRDKIGLGHMVDEKAVVNGIVGLLATGGSTNHTIHIVAIAAAAGIRVTWDDFADLSDLVPLIARVYPNGVADVNAFHAAGGIPFVMRELLAAGFLHDDVRTVTGHDRLGAFNAMPAGGDDGMVWQAPPKAASDDTILRPVSNPFQPLGGLKMLKGNLGEGVIKISAVKPDHRVIEAPAIVFEDQQDMLDAYKAGDLEKDFVAVIRFQGPKANGMPELHKLTPTLGVLLDKGFRVALVTDGRMSGASGKVPAAIHMTPEAAEGGPLAKVRTGDTVRLDALTGDLTLLVDDAELAARTPAARPDADVTIGRDLFATFRTIVSGASAGGTVFSFPHMEDTQ
ncbi:phosphogluconate dehydratase [Eilatimonas milleporae]|uniref:Phosphogluconate dehydratase n=1 Tax=Eilatimonas milleporae TaxID=911205 RepID=A0A3M0CD21_9PROT|nr:phosphogluconate dehydratase [Eilatimonas milleporae]RMB07731.1 6-phosphogluconate dehydratase [Eilatimonas milleporae]